MNNDKHPNDGIISSHQSCLWRCRSHIWPLVSTHFERLLQALVKPLCYSTEKPTKISVSPRKKIESELPCIAPKQLPLTFFPLFLSVSFCSLAIPAAWSTFFIMFLCFSCRHFVTFLGSQYVIAGNGVAETQFIERLIVNTLRRAGYWTCSTDGFYSSWFQVVNAKRNKLL